MDSQEMAGEDLMSESGEREPMAWTKLREKVEALAEHDIDGSEWPLTRKGSVTLYPSDILEAIHTVSPTVSGEPEAGLVKAAVEKAYAHGYAKGHLDECFRPDEAAREYSASPPKWIAELFSSPEPVADWVALHRPCTNEEHDPLNGKISGYCIRCCIPWPCKYSPESRIPGPVERREEALREALDALDPFARLGGPMDGTGTPPYHDMHKDAILYENSGKCITVGDVRAARGTLADLRALPTLVP